MTDIVELTRAWLEVVPGGDFDAFPGKVAPDFVMRVPFVPPGIPTEFRGRDTARKALADAARNRSKIVFSNVNILRTEDPELVVTTCDGQATMASGREYRNSYVLFTRIKDGVVLEHVEYLNPLAVMRAFTPEPAANES